MEERNRHSQLQKQVTTTLRGPNALIADARSSQPVQNQTSMN